MQETKILQSLDDLQYCIQNGHFIIEYAEKDIFDPSTFYRVFTYYPQTVLEDLKRRGLVEQHIEKLVMQETHASYDLLLEIIKGEEDVIIKQGGYTKHAFYEYLEQCKSYTGILHLVEDAYSWCGVDFERMN